MTLLCSFLDSSACHPYHLPKISPSEALASAAPALLAWRSTCPLPTSPDVREEDWQVLAVPSLSSHLSDGQVVQNSRKGPQGLSGKSPSLLGPGSRLQPAPLSLCDLISAERSLGAPFCPVPSLPPHTLARLGPSSTLVASLGLCCPGCVLVNGIPAVDHWPPSGPRCSHAEPSQSEASVGPGVGGRGEPGAPASPRSW